MTPGPWRLAILENLPSTQTALAEQAEAGAPHGTALLARTQTAGRGRGGRGWNSRPGNLHLSVLLRPAAPARAAPEFALLAGVALHAAAAIHAPVRLRWPNDLVLDGAKAGGILAEATPAADGGVAHLILGFGVNLAHAPALPDRPTAALGPVPPEDFARALLDHLGHWLGRHAREGFGPVRAAWMAAGPEAGSSITLRQGDRLRAGRYEGLAEDGALCLRTEAGLEHHRTGEVGAR